VYKKPNYNISEESPKTTSSQYGISKLLFEDKIALLFAKTITRFISIRVPCLLIPAVKGNFMAKWKTLINENKTISITNPDLTSNAFIDGDSIFAFALGYGSGPNLSFNVASKQSITFKHIAQILATAHKKKLLFDASDEHGMNQTIDTTLAEKYGFISPDLEDIVTEYSHA
jgi:nucleoside-diphosphate-sugar epimerase